MSASSAEETIESAALGTEKSFEVEPQSETSQQVPARLQENQNQDDAETTLCRVSVSYTPVMPNELQLDEGDIVEVLSKRPDGYWTGILRDKVGHFPSSFVTPITAGQVHKDANLKYCKVLYNCTTENDDELQLKENDIIEVIAKFEDGWWKGRLGNQVGLFPSNFVTMIPTPTTTTTSATGTSSETCRSSEATNTENTLTQCKVVVPFPGNNDDELTLAIGDIITIVCKDLSGDGLWWQGVLRGKTGIFPKNFVEVLTTASESRNDKPPLPSPLPTTNIPTDNEKLTKLEPKLMGKNTENNPSSSGSRTEPGLYHFGEEIPTQCLVTASYESTADDELTLTEGDIITVLSKDGCWWRGQLRDMEGYKTGWFPKSFVEELTSERTKKQIDESTSVPNVDECLRRFLEEEIMEKLKIANEEKNKCIICMECNINSAFFPCGHLTCCEDCAKGNEVCPLCRVTIERIERIYLPG